MGWFVLFRGTIGRSMVCGNMWVRCFGKEQMRSKKEQSKIECKLLLLLDYLFLFYIIIVLFRLFRALKREAPFFLFAFALA
jgi:hypothetical protein